MAKLSLADVAKLADGELHGDGELTIQRIRPLAEAGASDLSFVANARYAEYLQDSQAAAILIPRDLVARVPEGTAYVAVENVHLAMSAVLNELHPPYRPPAGVSPDAIIAGDVEIADGVSIAAGAVVEDGARIGARSVIGAGAVIGRRCVIGEDCIVHPAATLYDDVKLGDRCIIHSGARIGVDGFGYTWDGERHRKIPQVGGCVLGDEVEVGANSTIDRGSVGDTIIGRGTKIDNLSHIGHNCRVGENVIVIAQVGVSGSTSIGDGVILAGQAGIIGHATIGAGATVAARAGVIGDVPAGATVSGYPARPHAQAMRSNAAVQRLPELMRRVRKIEKAVFRDSE